MTASVNLQRWQFARRQRRLLLVACQGYLVLMALYDAWVWASKAGRLPYIYLPIYGLYLVVGALEMQFVHIVWHLQQHFRLLNHLMAVVSDASGPALWLPASQPPLPPHSSVKRRSPTVATVLRRALSAAQRALILRRPIVSPRYPPCTRPLGLKKHRDQLKTGEKCEKIRPYSSNGSHTPNPHLLTLHSLCEIHAELYDAVDAVNSAYGFQILVHTLSIFLHCIISPYFFLLNLLYPMTYGQTDPAFLSLQLMWILIHMSKLFLVVQPCSATCNEAKKTGSIVVKLLNVELQLPMKKQLEVFALQLLHRKVEFSAFGFCNLDFPLIASIAGSVTTYLVILIQFQNSDTVSAPNNPSN